MSSATATHTQALPPGWFVLSSPQVRVRDTKVRQATFLVYILSLLSITNAAYAFYRRRHYRLFESSIDDVPSTPSAHRVRVDSSPPSSSPLRFLSSMLAADNAESRAHPDAARDVWELAVWDPTLLSLRLFCLFSPGHIFLYWLFLPTATSDPRPSMTVATTIVLSALLSTQLTMLQCKFSQQAKDSRVVHKELLNEYDAKFVHPRTRPLMRDVGTQYSSTSTSDGPESNEVEIHTPSVVVNRGFHTRPNPNYVNHVDPDAPSRTTPSGSHPNDTTFTLHTPIYSHDLSSPFRAGTTIRQPHFKLPNGAPRTSDGGNLGVFSHANSPLRKSTTTEFGDARFRNRSDSPAKRAGSPLKRSNVASGVSSGQQRWDQLHTNAAKKDKGRF
ncbi:MAG: hypothetical protein Q9208_007963 [Pyrenodesmia sp. 3 TL-2023]